MSGYSEKTAPDTVQAQRTLPGPIERVWAYLTESDKRRTWLAGGDMDLREGGQVQLEFQNHDLSKTRVKVPEKYEKYDKGAHYTGKIIRCEPPRLLSFTWIEESGNATEVTFELSEQGEKVLLVVTHRRLPNRDAIIGVASGWHTHLDILVERLNGREPEPFWSTHERLEAEYEKRIPE